MTESLSRPGVLRVGDQVRLEEGVQTVVGLSGTTVRLVDEAGNSSVMLLSYLLSAPGFELVGAPPSPVLPPFGLLDALPEAVVERARLWERHLVEVLTGLPPDAPEDAAPRPEYDPRDHSLSEREATKSAELTAAGERISRGSLNRLRRRYQAQGLWGLVDHRSVRQRSPFGKADPRVVAAIRAQLAAETNESTGTQDRLRRRVAAALEAEHGPGVVPMPSKATFNRLVNKIAAGQHAFGSAVTRRSLANRPARPFTPTVATRPGEQVQIDTTPLDVLAVLDDGVPGRVELTMAVDVASRTICAAVLRPRGTKAVDAALLLARMLVPEPLRSGWADALAMRHSSLPYARLLSLDTRLEQTAAKPVIVPESITIDRGRVFVSEVFLRACQTLGISVQPARPRTPTDKPIIERTFESVNSLFCQHVAGYVGANTTRRGADVQAAWTLPELQDLLDEWVICWQARPHEGLRSARLPGRLLSPNEFYAALVARAGYLPVTLTGDDYVELLPAEWRSIQDYGLQLDYRTYDSPELNPYRHQSSMIDTKRGLWEVHYDPYDLSHVWVRNHHAGGWITVPWTHLPMVQAPFADFTWRYARQLVAGRGGDDTNQTTIAQVLTELLHRAEAGPPADRPADRRVAGRTRSAAALTRRPALPPATDPAAAADEPDEDGEDEHVELDDVVPFGVFDPLADGGYP